MRISSETVNSMSIASMQNAYNNYANILNKITSNKNFTKISENVADGIDLLKLKNQISGLEEYQGNIEHATNEMNLAYDTLNSIREELTSINTLVIEAANVSTNTDSAKAISTEISQRVETIKDLMNAKYLGNYIFSGTYVQEMPYTTDDEGNTSYNGSSKDAGERNLTISANTVFTYNFTGEEIFGKQNTADDFFAQMKDLDTLLNADTLDYDGIREKLGIIDTTSTNISQKNGIISSKVSKLEATKEINTDILSNLNEKRVNIEEVDIVKATSDLANANTALQASYILGSRAMSSVSLLDYI